MQAPATQQHQHQQKAQWETAGGPQQPRFQTLKFLGKGGQGFVQLAYDNLYKKNVAIKYIDRGWSRGFYKYVLRETLNHQQLSLCQHPHIVEFHEVFLTPSYLAVVMEYVNGTNLQHYLEAAGGKLPEDVARFIFQQLVIAVDFCHRKGKVNRDIKLANILLQEGHLPLVKLCDFGFSKDKFDDSEPQTQIGTALFTAPEIFTNTPGQVYDAEAADVWSCGVVLFVMLFGCHPFLSSEDTQLRKHAQVMKLIENAVRGQVQVPPGAAEQHPGALDLVRRILVSSPQQRCKLPAVMAHPWFQDKLPPGALLLNAAYLAMKQPAGNLRQTPEEVHAIITAALAAGAGSPAGPPAPGSAAADAKSESNSAGAPPPLMSPMPMQPNMAPHLHPHQLPQMPHHQQQQQHTQGLHGGPAPSTASVSMTAGNPLALGGPDSGGTHPHPHPHPHQQQQYMSSGATSSAVAAAGPQALMAPGPPRPPSGSLPAPGSLASPTLNPMAPGQPQGPSSFNDVAGGALGPGPGPSSGGGLPPGMAPQAVGQHPQLAHQQHLQHPQHAHPQQHMQPQHGGMGMGLGVGVGAGGGSPRLVGGSPHSGANSPMLSQHPHPNPQLGLPHPQSHSHSQSHLQPHLHADPGQLPGHRPHSLGNVAGPLGPEAGAGGQGAGAGGPPGAYGSVDQAGGRLSMAGQQQQQHGGQPGGQQGGGMAMPGGCILYDSSLLLQLDLHNAMQE